MTRDELLEIVERVVAGWSHSADKLGKSTIALWWDTLKDLDRDQVMAAVDALRMDGMNHAPTDGHIRRKVAELSTDIPPWPEVVSEVRKVLAFSSKAFYAGEFHDDRAGRLDRSPAAVRAFVDHVGWEALELFDPADTTSEAQLRVKWERFTKAAVEDRTLQGLPSGGLRRLERVNSGPRAFGDVVKALGEGS